MRLLPPALRGSILSSRAVSIHSTRMEVTAFQLSGKHHADCHVCLACRINMKRPTNEKSSGSAGGFLSSLPGDQRSEDSPALISLAPPPPQVLPTFSRFCFSWGLVIL